MSVSGRSRRAASTCSSAPESKQVVGVEQGDVLTRRHAQAAFVAAEIPLSSSPLSRLIRGSAAAWRSKSITRGSVDPSSKRRSSQSPKLCSEDRRDHTARASRAGGREPGSEWRTAVPLPPVVAGRAGATRLRARLVGWAAAPRPSRPRPRSRALPRRPGPVWSPRRRGPAWCRLAPLNAPRAASPSAGGGHPFGAACRPKALCCGRRRRSPGHAPGSWRARIPRARSPPGPRGSAPLARAPGQTRRASQPAARASRGVARRSTSSAVPAATLGRGRRAGRLGGSLRLQVRRVAGRHASASARARRSLRPRRVSKCWSRRASSCARPGSCRRSCGGRRPNRRPRRVAPRDRSPRSPA